MNIVNIDHVVIDENVSENTHYISPGGFATFMQKIYNKLPDISYKIISHYGKDFLKYTKKNVLYPPLPDIAITPRYSNITKNGVRIQKSTHRDGAFPVKLTDDLKLYLQKADIIIVSPLYPTYHADYLSNVMANTNKKAVTLLLPQGYYRNFNKKNSVIPRKFDESNKIIPLFDIVILSENDSPNIEHDVNKWLKCSDCIVIITKAEKGCEIYKRSGSFSVTSNPVTVENIVDSVGSGDIFSSVFVYYFAKTHDIKLSAKHANAVARECLFYTPKELDTVVLKSLQ